MLCKVRNIWTTERWTDCLGLILMVARILWKINENDVSFAALSKCGCHSDHVYNAHSQQDLSSSIRILPGDVRKFLWIG